MRALIAATVAIVSSAATAQTTNCSWVGSTWRCQQAPQVQIPAVQTPNAGSMLDAYRAGRDDRKRDDNATAPEMPARSAAYESNFVRYKVAQLLRRGDCKGAADIALQGGEIELAVQAKAFCSTP